MTPALASSDQAGHLIEQRAIAIVLGQEALRMPIYEYYCPECQAKFEVLRPMSRSDEPASCPICTTLGGRVLSTFASFSKGSDGQVASVGGGGCGGCAGGSCAGCHH